MMLTVTPLEIILFVRHGVAALEVLDLEGHGVIMHADADIDGVQNIRGGIGRVNQALDLGHRRTVLVDRAAGRWAVEADSSTALHVPHCTRRAWLRWAEADLAVVFDHLARVALEAALCWPIVRVPAGALRAQRVWGVT